MSIVLGVAMLGEALLLLWMDWARLGLAGSRQALTTFSFLTLLYFAVFSVISARERQWFWKTLPSRTLMAAVCAEVAVGTALTFAGLPDLAPLPWSQMLEIFGYSLASCLVLNDAIKVAMIRWRALEAIKTVPLPPQRGQA